MTTSDMIRELCEKSQTPQNFNKKLKRNTVSFEEISVIAETLGVCYEQAFIFPDGRKISSDIG